MTFNLFRETTSRLVIELRPNGYISLGTESALAVREAAGAILEVAPVGEGSAVAEKELLHMTTVKRTTGKQAMDELLKEGQLNKSGSGKKGDAFRYFVTEEIHSAGTSSSRAAESFSGSAEVPVGSPDDRREWGEVEP